MESALNLPPGSISEPDAFKALKSSRKAQTDVLRKIFIENVTQLMATRNWTTTRLSAETGIPLPEIEGTSSGSVIFKSLFMRHVVSVASVFHVQAWQLLMERGIEVARESAASFSELPAYVRWCISYIHSAVNEKSDGEPSDAAQTVTGLLPVLIGVLKYAQQESIRNPKIAEAAKILQNAFAPEIVTPTVKSNINSIVSED